MFKTIFYLIFIVLILLLLLLFLIFPRLSRKKEVMTFLDRYFAHRGLHANSLNIPENSLLAIKNAVLKDYGIEFDVHLSLDGVPVIIHDDNAKRVLGLDGLIEDLDYKTLRSKNLFSSNEKIPRLEEVLDIVNGKVPIIVELKGNKTNDKLCETVQKSLDKYDGKYIVESFNPQIMNWYKKNRKDVIRGQISAKNLKYGDPTKLINKFIVFSLSHMLFNFLSRPDFITYEKDVSGISYRILRLLKVPYISYTIKSEKELLNSKKNFDAFIFEDFLP